MNCKKKQYIKKAFLTFACIGGLFLSLIQNLPAQGLIPHYIPHTANMPQGLRVNAGPNVGMCNGDSVLLGASPSVSGGTAPVVYAWTPATGLNDSSLLNPKAFPAVTRTYTLTATDARNCNFNSMVRVSLPPLASFTVNGTGLSPSFSSTSIADAGFSQYSWTFGDGGTSSVANPSHSFPALDTYNVCLKITDSVGCQDSICQNVNIVVGLNPISALNDFVLFPNPTTGNVYLKSNLGKIEPANLLLYDLQGKVIWEKSIRAGTHSPIEIPISSTGIWLLKVKTENQTQVMRIERTE